uniref:Uncharacterized protein n=1 Tax=Sus scrofa TaxID=9823 RepID=A0A8D2BXR5_PIG
MSGTESTRQLAFESDEGKRITIIKGVRLSEDLILRRKSTSPDAPAVQRKSSCYSSVVSRNEVKKEVAKETKSLQRIKKQENNHKILLQDKIIIHKRAPGNEEFKRSVLRHCVAQKKKKKNSKRYLKKLEEKDDDIKRKNLEKKKQKGKLFSVVEELWKLGSNIWQRCADELEGKGKVWHCHELCCRLQAQVIQCSRENT